MYLQIIRTALMLLTNLALAGFIVLSIVNTHNSDRFILTILADIVVLAVLIIAVSNSLKLLKDPTRNGAYTNLFAIFSIISMLPALTIFRFCQEPVSEFVPVFILSIFAVAVWVLNALNIYSKKL